MRRLIAVSLLLLSICIPTSADGRSTADPNVGGVKAGKAQPSHDVTQKVTYEAKRKTVLAVLTDLSKMTGVILKAGYNNEDWQVRDRRMNIFAKDVPLQSLMDSMARVMKFQWSKHESDGVISYRLYMDRKVLLGAERQRYLQEQKLEELKSNARKRLAAELESVATKSDFELEGLKTQTPYMYVLAKMGYASLLPRLFKEAPLAEEAFVSGTYYSVSIGSLSQKLQQGVEEYEQAIAKNSPGHFTRRGKVSDGAIQINYGTRYVKGYGVGDTSIADIVVSVPGGTVQMGMEDPDSETAKLTGQMFIASWRRDSNESSRLYQLRRALPSPSSDLSEPLMQHTDDPALAALVEMNVEGNKLADALAALAESSGFAIVSDSFDSRYYGLSFPKEKTPIRGVLDTVESVCHYNWERHGPTLELRDRDWFRKRAAQIPEAWLEGWRTALAKNGTLKIDELSRIASLTPEQVWTNILPDEVLGRCGLAGFAPGNRAVLTLYSVLNRQQQALIFTKQGLSLSSLSGDQSKLLQALLKQYPGLQSASKNELRLTGISTAQAKRIRYTLTIARTSGDAAKGEWVIESPEYSPPPKEKPTSAPGAKPEVSK